MEELLKWCIEQKEKMKQMVDAMKSGHLKTYENGVEDTDFWIEENEKRIAELDDIIRRYQP
jgi:hypothetical protein